MLTREIEPHNILTGFFVSKTWSK